MNEINKLNKDVLKSVLKEQAEFFQKQDLGIERSQLKEVLSYAKSPYVTVISGLRRVGKSTLLAQIAKKKYKDKYYYINLEDERLINFKAADFDILHEVLIELFGEKKVFFLDEVQNIKGWERFVRRLSDKGYKFYVTGSNASLLSRELGTKLTGRYVSIELFPFSFFEFLKFKKAEDLNVQTLTTVERGRLKKLFNQYLLSGGIPDVLKYPRLLIHKTLYEDILYRDIVARYKLEAVKALKELSFYLTSNIASLISYNKLKELLKLGSVNTVSNFIEYLETSWLFFVVNIYAFSVKRQQIAPKKIYSIDTGLVKSVGFSFSENKGRLLENLVFLALRRKEKEIYYYKTEKGFEIDFYLPKRKMFIQVSADIAQKRTREREIRALEEGLKEISGAQALILTGDIKEKIKINKKWIQIKPIYEWLLNKTS